MNKINANYGIQYMYVCCAVRRKTATVLSLTDTELSDAAQRDVPTGFKSAALNLWNLSGARVTHVHAHVCTCNDV